jgi:hypothetical protein
MTSTVSSSESTPTPASRAVAQDMARTASQWLSELNEEQRAVAWRGAPRGDDESERRRWFYTPTDHGGLTFAEQSARQQRLAMMVLDAGLSAEGYSLVSTIMGTENILDRVEGFTTEFHTRRGRDPSRYYLRVFGDPEGSDPWGWRFGGHHISLNYLVVDGEVRSSTPRFFGLDPAVTSLPGGAQLDPLRAFEATARDLISSLSIEARAAAILLDRAPADIIMGNRSDLVDGATMMKLSALFRRVSGDEQLAERLDVAGDARDSETGYDQHDHETLALGSVPKGIPGAEMTGDQRQLFRRVVEVYHASLPDGLAPTWDVEELYFAWAGPIGAGDPHYYRIQGERLLIEWDNTARDANHAHAVVRDLANDFGGDVLGMHRQGWH